MITSESQRFFAGASFFVARLRVFACGAFLLSACGAPAANDSRANSSVATSESAVLYGKDDRTDYYLEADEAKRKLTRESIVLLANARDFRRSGDGTWAPTSGVHDSWCPSERFRDQSDVGFCSGTLIDKDIIVTAGHCTSQCKPDDRYIFNYYMTSSTKLEKITDADIYTCSQILAHSPLKEFDYAVVRLDRPVEGGHRPARVRLAETPLAKDSPVVLIGFPTGLPAKIDSGGRVSGSTTARDGKLLEVLASTDTYGGNSGSGQFTTDLELMAIHSHGENDFANRENCDVSRILNEAGKENSMYVFRAIKDVCGKGLASDALCKEGNRSETTGGTVPNNGDAGAGSGGPGPVGTSGSGEAGAGTGTDDTKPDGSGGTSGPGTIPGDMTGGGANPGNSSGGVAAASAGETGSSTPDRAGATDTQIPKSNSQNTESSACSLSPIRRRDANSQSGFAWAASLLGAALIQRRRRRARRDPSV
jgi:V8-like Glu-specific endopeptidase